MSLLSDKITEINAVIDNIQTKYNDLAACVTGSCNTRDSLDTLLATKTTQLNDLTSQLQTKANQDQLDLDDHLRSAHAHEVINLLPQGGSLIDASETNVFNADPPFKPVLLKSYNGSVIEKYGNFVHNNSTYGGTAASLPVGIAAMTSQRHGVSWNAALITAGSGQASPHLNTTNNVTYYLANYGNSVRFGERSTLGFSIYAIDDTEVYGNINGVTGYHVIPAGTKEFVVRQYTWAGGYGNYPSIRLAQPGDQCVVAKLVLTPGSVDLVESETVVPGVA